MEKIKIPDKIVTHVKCLNDEIQRIAIPEDIDFMGCSGSYVIEKIEMAMESLKWYKRRIEEVLGKRRKPRDPVWGTWSFGLSVECPHCEEHISNVCDIDYVWEGNEDIEILEDNKYKPMVFNCPECGKEITITNFQL